jgi:hypothetical protein
MIRGRNTRNAAGPTKAAAFRENGDASTEPQSQR